VSGPESKKPSDDGFFNNALSGKRDTLSVTINGEPHVLTVGSSVADVITQLSLSGQRIAVELNRCIVPKSQYSQTLLSVDDRLEVVHAMGGG